jgi:hypothetical protein
LIVSTRSGHAESGCYRLLIGTLIVAPIQSRRKSHTNNLLGIALDLLALGMAVVLFVSGWPWRGK